jgi:acetoin utilization protein AcuC
VSLARLDIAYGDRYLGWTLGPGHPTDPRRAEIATRLLVDHLPAHGVTVEVHEPPAVSRELLARVHSPRYVEETLAGWNDEWAEWAEARPDLGATAAVMCGGTVLLAGMILQERTRYAFTPQGAKHHAHRNRGGGFCVFNDMALAAHLFVDAGMRVGYLDLDVHHGDGVEALLLPVPEALTASVHEGGIFPGTGLAHQPEAHAFNWPLPEGSGDDAWLAAVQEAVVQVEKWRPDVLLLAIGADAHETDPLSSLRVTHDGYAAAGRLVRGMVEGLEVAVLMGGAGGYQPLTWTPLLWATVVSAVVGVDEPPRLAADSSSETGADNAHAGGEKEAR